VSDVTRYEMTTDIVPLPDGRWVRYEDYATLAAERDALKGEVANASALAFLRGLHVTDERADRMMAAALDARDDARAAIDAARKREGA